MKRREVAHDAQLLRVYRVEAERIAHAGGKIRRVVLDHELKREYQTFLNRPTRSKDRSVDDERRAFAERAQLPIVDGHLELPDLRIEYETPDGLIAYRDVELVTEHYSRGQLAGKVAAGFSLYRVGRGITPVRFPWHTPRPAQLGLAAMTFDDRVRALAAARLHASSDTVPRDRGSSQRVLPAPAVRGLCPD